MTVSKSQWIESRNLILKRKSFFEDKLEKAEAKRAEKLASMLKSTKLSPGEDPYGWPVMWSYNRAVTQYQKCLEEVAMDLVCVNALIKECA